MGSWGRCDFEQLKKLQEKMKKIQQSEIDKFCEDCAKELAARLLAKVIKRTPVGVYVKSSGKNGGTLRRGWTAGKRSGAKSYVSSLIVEKSGDTYKIEIINPVEYAPYVEFGHRTANHKGWVKGHFMLTISEQELERAMPKILENKLKKKFGDIFG